MSGLRKARAAGRVRHGVGITRGRVNRSSATHLSGKGPGGSGRAGRELSGIQSELVCDSARRAGTGLSHLPGCVVNAAKADARRSLDHDRDRKRGNGCGIRESQLQFSEVPAT